MERREEKRKKRKKGRKRRKRRKKHLRLAFLRGCAFAPQRQKNSNKI
jgi:hypothetical protein